jgi:hypothetical protein
MLVHIHSAAFGLPCRTLMRLVSLAEN